MYSEETSSLIAGGMTFEEYLPQLNGSYLNNYKPLLRLIERQDVDFVLRPYQSSVTRDFARVIGVDLPADDIQENRSYGPIALEAFRRISPALRFEDEVHWDRVRQHLCLMARAVDEDPYWGICPGHASEISNIIGGTEEICQAVWGKSWQEVLHRKQRPRNVYNDHDDKQRSTMLELLENMRSAAATITSS
jgi:hypothetical protein